MRDWWFGNKEFPVTGFNPVSSFLHSPAGMNRGIPGHTYLSPLCDSGLEPLVLTQRPVRSKLKNQFGNKCSPWHGRVDFPDYTQQCRVSGILSVARVWGWGGRMGVVEKGVDPWQAIGKGSL